MTGVNGKRVEWLWRSVPVRAMDDTRLTGTDYRVLMAVDSFDQMGAGGKGCVASRATIAERIGAHPKTVASSLRKLEKLGYLVPKTRKNGTKEYSIDFDQGERTDSLGGSELTPKGGAN